MTAKTIRVDVTAKDIAFGRPMNPEKCPVARALSRVMGIQVRATRARRDGHWVGVAHMALGPTDVSWRLPRATGQFMWAFDHHLPVQPFSFRVVK